MRKAVFLQFLILFVALIHSGCTGNLFRTPVTDPDQRITFGRISFLPPKGSGWKSVEQSLQEVTEKSNVHRIIFAKFPSENETAIAGVQTYIFRQTHIFSSDENLSRRELRKKLLKYYKHSWMFPYNHPKYKVVNSQYVFDYSNEAPCLLFENKNREIKGDAIPDPKFMTQNWGIACIHPVDKNEIYSLYISQKYLIGGTSTNLQNEFDSFLGSFQFL